MNGEVRHIHKSTMGIEFDSFEKSLPLVVTEAAKPALALKRVPFLSELNGETLRVTGLSKGNYTLEIDGEETGEFTAAQLAGVVKLAENQRTPQYQQSAAATKTSADRTKVGATIRDIGAQKYNLSKSKVNATDDAEVERHIRDQQLAAKENGKPINKA